MGPAAGELHHDVVARGDHLVDGDATVDSTGAVWHISAGTRIFEGLSEPALFTLKPYLRLVDEFLRSKGVVT